MPKSLTKASITALDNFNSDFNAGWTFGTNWSSIGTQFETFVNNYLFPKINETSLVNVDLGNRFNWLAKESDFIGQFSEEYVILDSVPTSMNLSKNEELMLKRNYPKMATKLYGPGVLKKQKFTLNNNDVRLGFLTLADAVKYAIAVYKKKLSDINVFEEKEIKAMIVDYALNQCSDKRPATSLDDVLNETYNAILNIQNNSEMYNESSKASGGAIGRYTTKSSLENVAILTNDRMKIHLLNTKIANTFQVAGIDISDRIISFNDLGGVYRVMEDVTIQSPETIELMRTFGDYQVALGDTVPADVVITYDVSKTPDFANKVVEIKPDSDLFSYVFDIGKLKYKRDTQDMLKKPFYNGEFDEVTYWLHYYSFKSVSPFYNSVLIGG